MRYLLAAIPLIIGLLSFTGGAKTPIGADADRLKAEYIYFESTNMLNESNGSDAYMMLRHAHQLDTADTDIAAALGEFVTMTGAFDSTATSKGYEAMKRHFFETGDFHSGATLATFAEKIYDYPTVRRVYAELARLYPDRSEVAYAYAWQLAVAYATNNDTAAMDSALAIYDRLEQDGGANLITSGSRVKALIVKKDTMAVINELGRLERIAPNAPEVMMSIAEVYEYIKRPDLALAYYNKACEADSTYGIAYLQRANFYLNQGDSASYDREVANVLRSPGLEFEAKFEMLRKYAQDFYADTASRGEIVRMFEIMEDLHSGEADLYSFHGMFLAACDSNAAAAEQFSYAMALNPEDIDNYQGLMQTAALAGDTIAVIAAGREATARFDNMYFPIMTSYYISVHETPQAAIELLDSFDISKTTKTEQISVYYQTRGDLLYQIGLNDSSFVEYNRALLYDPNNVLALNNSAYHMAVEDRDLDTAESYAKRALLSEPENPTYIDTYAWVLFRKKDYTSARREIDRALALYAHPAGSFLNESEDASTDATSAGEPKEEPSAEIYDHAGDIYFMNGEPEQALKFWKLALTFAPNDERIKKKVTHKTYFFE